MDNNNNNINNDTATIRLHQEIARINQQNSINNTAFIEQGNKMIECHNLAYKTIRKL